jgi:hypothetical protein
MLNLLKSRVNFGFTLVKYIGEQDLETVKSDSHTSSLMLYTHFNIVLLSSSWPLNDSFVIKFLDKFSSFQNTCTVFIIATNVI